ncbi:FtsB family cell division protein [Bacillus fonticola]|uniref:FtsB family cell division protein n=1 Tax=Bacillus fonticola TaxID=2728853 RepID=UPI0014728FDA|nr:septum formation initiator family protein [Bacillus fonticola]
MTGNVTPLREQQQREWSQQDEQRRKKRKYLVRRLTMLFLVTFLAGGALITGLVVQAQTKVTKQEQYIELQEKLSTLEQEQQDLENQIEKLNDDEYVGKLAREEYYLSDDNEIIFSLPDDE